MSVSGVKMMTGQRFAAYRIKLEGQPVVVVVAASQGEAARIARWDWAASNRRAYWAAPRVVSLRRCEEER